jgi:signal transduction histidine kinase
MGFTRSLKGRLTISVAVAIIVTGSVVLLFGYFMARASLNDLVYQSLEGVISRTSAGISALARSTESLAVVASSTTELAEDLSRYSDAPGEPSLITRMSDVLVKVKGSLPAGSRITLITLDRRKAASADEPASERLDTKTIPEDLLSRAVKGETVHDYYEVGGEIVLATVVPVSGAGKAAPVGVLAVEIPASAVGGILTERAGMSSDGRIALSKSLGGKVAVLMPSGGGDGSAELDLLLVDQSSELPFSRAAKGSSGEGKGRIPGVGEVVYSYDFIPETGWGVTAMVDADEAFASVNRLRNVNVLVILILVICGCLLAYLIASSMTRPLDELQKDVQSLANGDLDARASAGGGTEIAALADEFNMMAERLNDLLVNLERNVDERTRELQQANERLEQLDRLKNDFISMASHELRSPLSSMKMGVSTVAKEIVGPLNEEQKTMLEIAERNIDRLNKISTDLLDLTRIEAGELDLLLEEQDIPDLIKEVVAGDRPSAQQKGLALEVAAAGPLLCRCDRDRVIQVLHNLVNNAINYTEEGGITVSAVDEGDTVTVSVSDTGIGIPPESLESVFEKWSRAHAETRSEKRGTGLGLAICKGIVEAHDGVISVDSEPGKGSTFTFRLPKRGPHEGTEKDNGG